MRTPNVVDRTGFRHEVVFYGSSDELLETVLLLVRDGAAADEPTLLLARPDVTAAVLDEVPDFPDLVVLPLPETRRPAADLQALQKVVKPYLRTGRPVRVVNQMPTSTNSYWPEWRRYEAASNLVFQSSPVWGLCLYDRAQLTEQSRRDLLATHPVVGSGSRHRPNDRYVDPEDFLSTHFAEPADPVESTPPTLELIDPSPAVARAAVTGFSRASGLSEEEVQSVVFASNEAVTNALVHGRRPVTLRLWLTLGAVVILVHDTGPGPSDPLVGLVPQPGHQRTGSGLWLAHQLVDMVHRRDLEGYTVRITASLPCSPAQTVEA